MSFSTLYFRSNIVVLTMGFLHSKYLMSCDKIMINNSIDYDSPLLRVILPCTAVGPELLCFLLVTFHLEP